MTIPIQPVVKFLRNRFITWLDRDTGLPRSTSYMPVSSGVNVTEESAMRVTAVFACVRIISWTLASLPLHLYRRVKPRGKERAPDHKLYRLLHDRPNPEQTSFQFRSLLAAHQCLWGNGYAEIEFDQFGEPVALWPIPAWLCTPCRTSEKRELFYEIRLTDGTQKKLPPYRVWHVMGISLDGMKGLSPIGMAREAIGLSMAAETFGASFFGNGLNPGGIAEHPNKLSEEAHKRLKESLNEKYEGLGKAHRLMLLEEGMKFTKVGIAPEEAQFLETRKFQVADIARLYGVPPHMIGDTEKSTSWGTGIEQQGIGFVVYSMRPYLVSWEQETSSKLLSAEDQIEYFPEFAVDGLLRGDIKSRYASYAVGRQWGWLSVNDVRELENMNPVDGGDRYITPLNMIDATKLLEDEKNPEGSDGEPLPAATDTEADPEAASDTENDQFGIEDMRAYIDAYGIGVRAGVITPQPEDEKHFREKGKLPVVTEAVTQAWKKDGGVRRPVTLAVVAGPEASGGQAGEDPASARSARSLAPIFADAAARILRREEADVMRQARKLSPDALRSWLAGFYMEHRDFVSSQFAPSAEVSGLDDLTEFSEKYAQSRYAEIDGAATNGADALQTRFDETRNTRTAEMVGHFTGGTR
ncbi:MAG: phage portal protein [Treponema sp. GWC1_61_84]|nr:MAG: phage portal protein [Treponema sp. GWC1_61_84]